MEIDWVTIAAQVINFLILVALLHRFLYRPIVAAMVRREERIKERAAEADRQKQEAEEEAKKLAAERHDFEQRREQLLGEVREEASELKRKLSDAAREEVAAHRAAWREELREDQATFLSTVTQHAEAAVRQLAEQAFGELADSDLEDRITAVFVERLEALDDAARSRLRASVAESAAPARIETGKPLSAEARRRLTTAVHKTLGGDVEVNYKADAELVFGVRLRCGSQVVEWTLGAYLDRFSARLADIFRRAEEAGHARPEAAHG